MDIRGAAPVDPHKINVRERGEVAWWCGELGCSANELRRAVSAVGVSAERVQEFIERFTAQDLSPHAGSQA